MRILCPSCAAAYDVPDERLAPGRPVKCAQCGTSWAPVVAVLRTAPPEAAAPPPAPASPMQIFERLAMVPPPVAKPSAAPKPVAPSLPPPAPPASLPPASPAVAVAWVASIVLLLLVAGAAYVWRAQVMQAWPPSVRAYALVGLAPG